MGREMSKTICAILRVAEIVCGTVVLVLMASFVYAHKADSVESFGTRYFVSTGIALISVLVALLFLPSCKVFPRYFLLDLLLSIVWFAAFALLIMNFSSSDCAQGLSEIKHLTAGGTCDSQRAAWGFAFLSGCLWLGTFVVGTWVVLRERKLESKPKRETFTMTATHR